MEYELVVAQHGMSPAEYMQAHGALFPGVRWALRTLTSDVGIAARAARVLGAGVLPLLDALRVLRTHLLGIGTRA